MLVQFERFFLFGEVSDRGSTRFSKALVGLVGVHFALNGLALVSMYGFLVPGEACTGVSWPTSSQLCSSGLVRARLVARGSEHVAGAAL